MLTVTVIEAGKPGRVKKFERFPVTIGRAASSDINLLGWKIGRLHAEFQQIGANFKLVDRGSFGGTWVNSERIVEYGPVTDSDEITIGGFRLKVQVPLPGMKDLTRLAQAEAALPAPVVSEPAVESAPAASLSDTAVVATDAATEDTELARYLKGFEWRRAVHRVLLETIDLRRKDVRQFSDQDLRAESETLIREILQTRLELPAHIDRELLISDVLDEVVGLGALEKLLADPTVTEVMVNRADEIYVERKGKLERCKAAFTSDEAIRAVIDRIVAPLGRRIDEASPMVDARLKDGSRVNAIIPPLALKGPTITIRKFNRRVFGPEDIVRLGTANDEMLAFLRVCVVHRKNIVVAGGTGSGKTTLLNVLSNLIPKGERVITIEDAAELKLNHPHLVSLEARPSNVEGKGVVAIRDLVRNSLRMRPDRIIVGECRGGETLDMLQAMNTGHDGSLTTVHANSPRDVISRLEVMTLLAGLEIPVSAIREQVASAVDVIVQQMRLADGSRRITSIVEVTGVENGTVQLLELFRFARVGFEEDGRVIGHYTACNAVPTFYEDLRSAGAALELRIFEPNPLLGLPQ
jgi:pilus assembly protein CpaF